MYLLFLPLIIYVILVTPEKKLGEPYKYIENQENSKSSIASYYQASSHSSKFSTARIISYSACPSHINVYEACIICKNSDVIGNNLSSTHSFYNFWKLLLQCPSQDFAYFILLVKTEYFVLPFFISLIFFYIFFIDLIFFYSLLFPLLPIFFRYIHFSRYKTTHLQCPI